jgi:predicted transposase/invertase (TIGR01784 family)
MFMKYRHEKRAEALIGELCRKEAGIMKAEQAVTKVSRDYIKYARKMAEIKNSMDRAERQLALQKKAEAEGLQEGLEKGLVRGMEEGLKKGMEKGRAEGHAEKTLEIARRMKNAGRPLNEIAEFTGLPTETIEQLLH